MMLHRQSVQRVRACLLAQALLLGCVAPLTAQASPGAKPAAEGKSCVVIDNDFDIDDMMAIPPVLGMKHVAAIIQSEGYTLPEQAAPALDQLINHLPDQPNSRKIPVIVGAKQQNGPDLNRWSWLPFFRAMMNRANGLLPSEPKPWAMDHAYVKTLQKAVDRCDRVSVLIIGTYTSFVNYLPAIRDKIDRVVIMGQRIGDNSATMGRESFNCNYDFKACQKAMPMLAGLKTFFVDIPRFDDCHDTTTPAARCYNPSYAMVAGTKQPNGVTVGGLRMAGLPGRLRKALINSISCTSLYTTPKTKGRPCSSLSTWEPAAVAKGPGGEMLLWDQTAAHFLIRPQDFALYYPPKNPELGGQHYQPKLVDGSEAKTAQKLRRFWTEFSNQSILIK